MAAMYNLVNRCTGCTKTPKYARYPPDVCRIESDAKACIVAQNRSRTVDDYSFLPAIDAPLQDLHAVRRTLIVSGRPFWAGPLHDVVRLR
jgi:hypothetical protein